MYCSCVYHWDRYLNKILTSNFKPATSIYTSSDTLVTLQRDLAVYLYYTHFVKFDVSHLDFTVTVFFLPIPINMGNLRLEAPFMVYLAFSCRPIYGVCHLGTILNLECLSSQLYCQNFQFREWNPKIGAFSRIYIHFNRKELKMRGVREFWEWYSPLALSQNHCSTGYWKTIIYRELEIWGQEETALHYLNNHKIFVEINYY